MKKVVVIGAGIGGLTAAALMLRVGYAVTVLEAQAYAGGSAGTFFHKGYRFDAGATLAGGFAPGGPHARLAELLELDWPVSPVDPAWVVHLPGQTVTQWSDRSHWEAERQWAFPGTEFFWRWQEKLAAAAWDVSSRHFPWPPENLADVYSLLKAFRPATALAAPAAFLKVGSLMPHSARREFRAFVDAQLIISAQTTAGHANALYGSAALDLPRRGVNAVRGGMGGLAKTLVEWIKSRGGEVLYLQRVEAMQIKDGKATGVRTNKGLELAGGLFIANLSPLALEGMLGKPNPKERGAAAKNGWGAFMLYLGLDETKLPPGLADHHQVIVDPAQPPGEGNTVFISLSDPADGSRAPQGQRAATLSTHTTAGPWWDLLRRTPEGYALRKLEYTEKVLTAAESAIPGIRQAIQLCLPGTPVTFQDYTHRPDGLVGGFPQTSLFKTRGPATGLANVWLVGDSIFPGQSTAGVTLGAMRTARNAQGSPA